jgi:hypothetical protein
MGEKGIERKEMVKMISTIKCGALRPNLAAIQGMDEGKSFSQFGLWLRETRKN